MLCSWLEIPHFSYTVTLFGVGMGLALHSLLLIIYLAENMLLDKSCSENYFQPIPVTANYCTDNLTCSFCTTEGETGLSRANMDDGSKKMCSVETCWLFHSSLNLWSCNKHPNRWWHFWLSSLWLYTGLYQSIDSGLVKSMTAVLFNMSDCLLANHFITSNNTKCVGWKISIIYYNNSKSHWKTVI